MRPLFHPSPVVAWAVASTVALAGTLAGAPTVRAADRVAPQAAEPATKAAEPGPTPGELFSSGLYLEAAAAFGAAFDETGDPAMLFGRATALRRAGDCAGAIESFEAFLATEPPQADVDEANRVIDACEQILEPLAKPPPRLPEVAVSPPPPRVVVRGEMGERRWQRDPAGGALLGAGVTVAVAGAVVLGVGASRARDREESEAGFERRERSVRSLNAVGTSLLVAGGALLVGSVIRYAVVARRR